MLKAFFLYAVCVFGSSLHRTFNSCGFKFRFNYFFNILNFFFPQLFPFPYFADHYGCSVCIKVCPFNQVLYQTLLDRYNKRQTALRRITDV